MALITVRDDDVLVHSSSHADPEARFVKVHEIIIRYGATHVPSILCGDIQDFPGTIKYIKAEMALGRMAPQLHGWRHVDYGKMTDQEVDADLGRCVEWFNNTLGQPPSIFYTPWGADSPKLRALAEKHSMKLVGVDGTTVPSHIRRDPDKYLGRDVEIFIHWWQGVNRLENALRIVKNG